MNMTELSGTDKAEQQVDLENTEQIQPGTVFWQMLTGYKNSLSVEDLDYWISPASGKFYIPPDSELKWVRNGDEGFNEEKVMGLMFKEIIHNSWTGLTDHIRIISVKDQSVLEEVVNRLYRFDSDPSSVLKKQPLQLLDDN